MTANEMYKIFQDFIKNDFTHLRKKVDKLLWVIISGLVTIVVGLVLLIAR